MIIITGATGHLGSRIVEHLLERIPPHRVGVSVRNPDKAGDLHARGVRVRQGDFGRAESLSHAFEGATQVLVVSAATTGGSAVGQHAAVIDAARNAGAQRVLYTSHQAASPDSLFAPMPDHAATEQYLADQGGVFTALRNGFYASFVPRLIGPALKSGELIAPADGPVSWTTHEDLAAAAAAVLADPGLVEGVTPPLTGPQALDLEDITKILTTLSGRTIKRVIADDEEYTANMVQRGAPKAQASMMLGMFKASRRGEFNTTGPTLEQLIGRPTAPLSTILNSIVAA